MHERGTLKKRRGDWVKKVNSLVLCRDGEREDRMRKELKARNFFYIITHRQVTNRDTFKMASPFRKSNTY